MIVIKSEKELTLMRESGKILHTILQALATLAIPGRNLLEFDTLACDLARKHNARCTFKGYRGFPSHVCLSLNDEVVHGIPRDKVLQDGDILGIDLGITYEGYITDGAITLGIGIITPKDSRFLKTVENTLYEVIRTIHTGIYVGDISSFIQTKVEEAGYSIVKELTGHGVGRSLHEDPFIPNYGEPKTGLILQNDMTLAIEPIIAMGRGQIQTDTDGWTIRTTDGSLACQFEHTIIVHDTFAEIIT